MPYIICKNVECRYNKSNYCVNGVVYVSESGCNSFETMPTPITPPEPTSMLAKLTKEFKFLKKPEEKEHMEDAG